MNKHTNIALLSSLFALGIGAIGCNNTVQSMTIPETVVWDTVFTGLASPYHDLTIVPVGDDIHADWEQIDRYAYCQDPVSSQGSLHSCATPGQCEQECTDEGLDFLGERTWYIIGVWLNRPAFQVGSVQLVSEEEGLVNSITLAVSPNTQAVEITAGVSEGTFPAGTEPNVEEFIVDNFTYLDFSPHDPNFGYLDAFPYVACLPGVETAGDAIAFNTALPADQYDFTCGSIPVSLNLVPEYPSVGACISDSIQKHCKDKGLTGKDRATCNSAQIGNCHASFHVPSSHAN